MLVIKNLCVSINTTQIIADLSLTLAPGTTHTLIGPNGSGKSTCVLSIMGHPMYQITAGSVVLEGNDITALSADKRALQGIFLAFQSPYAIPGVTVYAFLKEAFNARNTNAPTSDFTKELEYCMAFLGLERSFADRGVNQGFSGGEKKRFELLTLLLLKPRIVLLDEIDSGLDRDGINLMYKSIAYLRTQHPESIVLFISHAPDVIRHVHPDYVHVLKQGRLIQSGDMNLYEHVVARGYDALI